MSFRPFFETALALASANSAGLVKGDGNTVSIAPDGTISVVGVAVTALTDAGPLALSDKDVINRAGTDYSTTQSARVALFQKTPPSSRTATLPVILTAADNNRNVLLTGATGTLSVDGTVGDGFYCRIVNVASGAATYSGITGLQSTTSIASGGVTHVMMAGATVYASASAGTTVAAATAYATALSAPSGAASVPVTMTFSPNGAWQAGQTISPTAATLAGTFGSVTNGALSAGVITPSVGNSTPVTVQFTPSSPAGTSGTLSSTPSAGETNTTGALTYVVLAALATSYALTGSASSGLTGGVLTLTLAPNGGNWPANTTITLASTVAGAFANGSGGTLSGSVLTPPASASTACTVTYTPSAAGAATITATNSASLTDPSSLAYTVSAPASALSFMATAGNPSIITVTPTNGAWPVGITLTGSIVTGGTLAGTFGTSTAPVAGSSAAAVLNLTPSSAAGTSGSITVTASPPMTNSTGGVTYTVVSIVPYPSITTSSVSRVIVADASVLTGTNGNTVTSLPDQSGYGRNFTGGTATLVTGAQNGLNGIMFAGASTAQAMQAVTSAAANLGGDFSGLLVLKAETFNGSTIVWAGNSGTTSIAASNGSDQVGVYTLASPTGFGMNRITNSSTAGGTSVAASSGAVHKIAWRYTAASATTDTVINGTEQSVHNPQNVSPNVTASAAWNLVTIGAGNSSNTIFAAPYIGEFLELQLFNGLLSDSDFAALQSYATSKWGS